MAAIKFKSALGVERSCEEGFGGIDRTSHQKSSDRCFRMENLDHRADGSLRTRPGYRQQFEYTGELRAIFNTSDKLYTVVGDSFILHDASLGTSTVLATLPSSSGDAEIICFGGDMYVHDGSWLYRYYASTLAEAEGYAPLYGSDWNPSSGGDVNEDINILSDRIRISFVTDESTQYFNLGINVSSIDLIQINGKTTVIDALGAAIDETEARITTTSPVAASTRITFWLTLSSSSSKKHLIEKRSRAFVFGNNGGERLCIYSPGLSSSLLCSRPVSTNAHRLSLKSNSNALPLYMPFSSVVCIGSGAYPITGMAQHFGRALLFTETDTWCVDWNGSELDPEVSVPEIFMLNSAIGSEETEGSAYCENDPITYFCGRLWRWHSQSGVRDECSASLISDEVAELLPKNSYSISMLSLPQRQKILIADPEDTEGKLLVFDTARKSWTVYKGIYAEKLIRFGNYPAFSRGSNIYVFFDDLTEDSEESESFPIKAILASHFTDFGCPERTKRSVRLILCCDLSGGEATVTFENEIGETRTLQLKGKKGGGAEQISERMALPRFKKLRYTIESQNPITLYSAILSAK